MEIWGQRTYRQRRYQTYSILVVGCSFLIGFLQYRQWPPTLPDVVLLRVPVTPLSDYVDLLAINTLDDDGSSLSEETPFGETLPFLSNCFCLEEYWLYWSKNKLGGVLAVANALLHWRGPPTSVR